MKKYLNPRLLLTAFIVAILAVFLLTTVATAATSQNVTVSATPNYLDITNSPGTWDLNGITGTGVIDVDTIYYSNPLGDTTAPSATVVDGECRFTMTNNSGPDVDVYVNMGNFTGGDANMTNSDDGTNGASTYGGHSWYSGLTYSSKVIMKSTGSGVLYDEYGGASLKWGAEVETQTGAWAGAGASTATMVISVQAD